MPSSPTSIPIAFAQLMSFPPYASGFGSIPRTPAHAITAAYLSARFRFASATAPTTSRAASILREGPSQRRFHSPSFPPSIRAPHPGQYFGRFPNHPISSPH